MFRTEAETFARIWESYVLRVFRMVRPLMPDEYITVSKKDIGHGKFTFEVDPARSTYKSLRDIDAEMMVKLLVSEEIRYIKDWTWGTDTLKMKTGGCTCGAWALRPSERIHVRECPLWIGK